MASDRADCHAHDVSGSEAGQWLGGSETAPEGQPSAGNRASIRDAIHRERQRARRETYRSLGLCPYCGRDKSPDRTKCKQCLDAVAESMRRRRAAAAKGETATRKESGPAHRKRRSGVRKLERLALLVEVRDEWRRIVNDGKGSFFDWIEARIQRERGE
jgi:hypothetical protein